MTMLTRCAACGTAFRITDEQLALRQGKVRCGACSEVFSALEHLVHTPHEMICVQSEQDTGTESLPAPSSLSTPEMTTAQIVLDGPAMVEVASSAVEVQVVSADGAATLTHTGPAAMPHANNFRWVSVAGAFLAFTVFCYQTIYFYRDELAARIPESKPWLLRMCAQLSCTFDAPRDAQAISIESHDLQADPANKKILALTALLRNRADFVQDAPFLELTLTDAQDAPIARRVLAPRDYLAVTQMAAGAELQVRVLIDASQVRASGYRLYAFYP